MKALAFLLGLCLVGGIASQAKAAELEVQPVIGGNPMRCHDFRGAVVRTLQTTDLGDVGRASIVARVPVIQLDSERLAKLPPKLQIFFFMHECAHLVTKSPNEVAANCLALKVARQNGLTREIEAEIGKFHYTLGLMPAQFGGSGKAYWDATMQCAGDRDPEG